MGAVAHLAQLPAAAPRCRDLSDSSLADRAGQGPSRCRRREWMWRGPGPFTKGVIVTPLPLLLFLRPPPSPSPGVKLGWVGEEGGGLHLDGLAFSFDKKVRTRLN